MKRLEVCGLHCGYGDKPLLRDVSFSLAPGEALSIVGANGTGKSTLLATLSGALHPLSGEIWLGGERLERVPARVRAQRMTLLLQQQPLDPGIRVRELVALGRTPWWRGLRGMSPADWEQVDAAIEMCDLVALADRPVGAISGGERQRARLAMVVAQNTGLILLDEPTNHLDVAHRFMLHRVVENLRTARQTTVISVLHALEDARRYAPRMLYLHGGTATCYEQSDYERLREHIVAAADVPPEWVY
ncbi:MAG: ABC transporter ATP-binding protein [Proteobacteria bacterium]|nr:ABC transporter ATP-binding protein [Pseudomonadota bacterium]